MTGLPAIPAQRGSDMHALCRLLHRAIDSAVRFKRDAPALAEPIHPLRLRDELVDGLPEAEVGAEAVTAEIVERLLPWCKNEAHPQFCGFGDTGDDPAALAAGVLAMFSQQNLINQRFDAPAATFVEIAVLRWLRDALGFENQPLEALESVWEVGGAMTTGGTMSNTIAMMLAREQRAPGTMNEGVEDAGRFSIIVPAGIGHYSVRAACTWIGTGVHTIEVPTSGFRYDLNALSDALAENVGRIMAVVAYAGDSRTQTIDRLGEVARLVRSAGPDIWLHADACWGLPMAFSERLRHRLTGIEQFDSITVDPHKVMAIPYSLSALLVRRPESLKTVSTFSDLIMQEDFALGQVTPFLGTKSWGSLKLWAMMRSHGRPGLARIAEERVRLARHFADLVDAHPRLVRLNDPDMAAVAFCYLPIGVDPNSDNVERINAFNAELHTALLQDRRWFLHTFTLTDDLGRIDPGATVQVLRFTSLNSRLTEAHMTELLDHLDALVVDLYRSANEKETVR
ncbi:pyridoxal phosphate-dependent decarboxylase family protein [Glycomyces xiaoerkulensis]|uniref:pyridoxal phosphate-dependent decarboxylase family protein n=1 Tax=Glycomyces xiaoerkulensis TaxID=2038139 RepID=UPI0018E4D486|nr:pyridoxal-dependent decarboxylase [Glycomyces xiaoerkulensis]